MPNWCSNAVTVSGRPSAIATLRDRIRHARETQADLFAGTVLMDSADQNADANRARWGTKWDVALNDVRGLDHFLAGQSNTIRFATANCPPDAWATRLTRHIDGLGITIAFAEYGMDVAGFVCCMEGQRCQECDDSAERALRRFGLGLDNDGDELLDRLLGVAQGDTWPDLPTTTPAEGAADATALIAYTNDAGVR